MAQSDTKTEIKVKVDVRPGPALLSQKASWARFWSKVLSEATKEVTNDRK